MKKLFAVDAPLESLQAQDPVNQVLNTYYFSVLFTQETICNLYSLNAQLPKGVWNQLITKNIVESDGEITIEIGTFSPGTKVNFIFGIQAITDIPSLMTFIVNGTTKKTVRVLATDTKKKLSNGEVWNGSIEEYPLHD